MVGADDNLCGSIRVLHNSITVLVGVCLSARLTDPIGYCIIA